jgi:arsenate reductase-like glutaredoxin family protein
MLGGTLPEGVEDAIASGDSNAIVDMLYETMKEMLGEEVPITKEQLQTFVEESTVTDYIAEKAAGYAEDIINGTENTQITAEELVDLLEENKELIEQTFEVEITEEAMAEIEANVTTIVEENDINGTIRAEINNVMESAGAEGSGIPLAQIMEIVRLLSQNTVMYSAIGACVVLILLLCGANFYNIPAGMTWAAVPCILIGGILAAPIAVLQLMPSILGELAAFAPMVNVLAPIHYAVPVTGLVLLIGSIVWRIVRSCIRHDV